MIPIILLTLFGLYVGVQTFIDLQMYTDMFGWLFSPFLVGLFGGIGFLLGFGIAVALLADTKTITTNMVLVSVKDNSNVTGSFYLGSGYIKEKMVYTFYKKDGNNSYRLMQVPAEDARIVYTIGTPQAIERRQVPTKSFINWFAIDLDDPTYKICVPQGSIKNNFTLDAQ